MNLIVTGPLAAGWRRAGAGSLVEAAAAAAGGEREHSGEAGREGRVVRGLA